MNTSDKTCFACKTKTPETKDSLCATCFEKATDDVLRCCCCLCEMEDEEDFGNNALVADTCCETCWNAYVAETEDKEWFEEQLPQLQEVLKKYPELRKMLVPPKDKE